MDFSVAKALRFVTGKRSRAIMDKCRENSPISFNDVIDSSSVSSEELDILQESNIMTNDLIENTEFIHNSLNNTTLNTCRLGYKSPIEVNNLNVLGGTNNYINNNMLINHSSDDVTCPDSEQYNADDEHDEDFTESDHTEEYSDDDSILNEAVEMDDISPFISPLGSEDSGYITSPDQLG